MRVIIISLIFLCLISPFANAEGTWEEIHHIIGSDWQDVFFLDESHGWAVGWQGGIASTKDGGKTWDTLHHDYSGFIAYYGCCFVSEDKGWIVGDNVDKGVLLSTDDGGKTLKAYEKLDGVFLQDVYFTSQDEGWVVGSQGKSAMILHTENSGKDWTIQDGGSGYLRKVFFLDEKKGFAVGKTILSTPLILQTDDGGKTWIKSSIQGVTGEGQDIFFLNQLEGWIVFNTSLIKTTDGGSTWQKVSIPQAVYLTSVGFTNSNEGLLIGTDASSPIRSGIIIQTKDGCQSFESQTGFSGLNAMACLGNKCWIMGGDNTIIYSQDGENWLPQVERAYAFHDVDFVGKDNGFLSGLTMYYPPGGDFVIFSTSDGGRSWEEGIHVPEDWCCLSFLNSSSGWIGGFYGLCHTDDGGKTIQKDEGSFGRIYDIAFPTKDEGWLVGDSGIWRTSDGEKTWQETKIDLAGGLLASIAIINNKAWAVGAVASGPGGFIFKTENGGKSFSKTMMDDSLMGVSFITENNGWAVGGAIYTTEDGGKSWQRQKSETNAYLSDVLFLSEKEGWTIGTEGTILHTIDSGKTWTKQESHSKEHLNKIAYNGDDSLFVVGDWGTILKYTDPLLSQYSSRFFVSNTKFQPITWGKIKNQLFQNYPNPFNPETWIPYQLAEDTETTINIYNAEGNLVRTLDLGNKKAGSYQAYWDGKDNKGQTVASGVYFYILKSKDGYTDTKKMVLVR